MACFLGTRHPDRQWSAPAKRGERLDSAHLRERGAPPRMVKYPFKSDYYPFALRVWRL